MSSQSLGRTAEDTNIPTPRVINAIGLKVSDEAHRSNFILWGIITRAKRAMKTAIRSRETTISPPLRDVLSHPDDV
eukprot:1284560-Amorphochlora_amoeboformis.AAC.1